MARRILLHLGPKKLGEPPKSFLAALEHFTSARLERMINQLDTTTCWELLPWTSRTPHDIIDAEDRRAAVEQAIAILFQLGCKKLGDPTRDVVVRLAAIANGARVERMIGHLFDNTATTWTQVLETR